MAGKATPLPPASLTPRRRRSPNGSNASAQKACMGCVTAPQDLFHRTAKLRKPHATPLRSCADSATPGSRSQPKLASRHQEARPHWLAGKRLAQELIVNEKITLLLGGITPSALSVAPLTAEAKIPM